MSGPDGTDTAHRPGLRTDGVRFVTVGLGVLPAGLAVHLLATAAGTGVHAARALSFAVGSTLVYLAHRRWASRGPGGPGGARPTGFAALYGATFVVVLGIHAIVTGLLPPAPWAIPTAWLVSQGVGTTVNFVLLRTVVSGRPPLGSAARG